MSLKRQQFIFFKVSMQTMEEMHPLFLNMTGGDSQQP